MAIVKSGLVSYFNYRQSFGGFSWSNLANPNAGHAFVIGPTKTADGISFDGVDDYFSSSAKLTTGSYCVEVLLSTSPTSSPRHAFMLANNDSLVTAYRTDTNAYTFASNSSTSNAHTGTTVIRDNQFHNVLVQYNHITGDKQMYINGIKELDVKASIPFIFDSTSFMIGRGNQGSYQKCVVKAVRIYNRALTAQEVMSNYQTGDAVGLEDKVINIIEASAFANAVVTSQVNAVVSKVLPTKEISLGSSVSQALAQSIGKATKVTSSKSIAQVKATSSGLAKTTRTVVSTANTLSVVSSKVTRYRTGRATANSRATTYVNPVSVVKASIAARASSTSIANLYKISQAIVESHVSQNSYAKVVKSSKAVLDAKATSIPYGRGFVHKRTTLGTVATTSSISRPKTYKMVMSHALADTLSIVRIDSGVDIYCVAGAISKSSAKSGRLVSNRVDSAITTVSQVKATRNKSMAVQAFGLTEGRAKGSPLRKFYSSSVQISYSTLIPERNRLNSGNGKSSTNSSIKAGVIASLTTDTSSHSSSYIKAVGIKEPRLIVTAKSDSKVSIRKLVNTLANSFSYSGALVRAGMMYRTRSRYFITSSMQVAITSSDYLHSPHKMRGVISKGIDIPGIAYRTKGIKGLATKTEHLGGNTMTQMAQDFSMYSGNSKTLIVTVRDDRGLPVVIDEGSEVTWVLAKEGRSTLRKTIGSGIKVQDNMVYVDITAIDTKALFGNYDHELVVSLVSGGTYTVTTGTLKIIASLIK